MPLDSTPRKTHPIPKAGVNSVSQNTADDQSASKRPVVKIEYLVQAVNRVFFRSLCPYRQRTCLLNPNLLRVRREQKPFAGCLSKECRMSV